MPTGGDLVTRALKRLTVKGVGQTPSAEDMEDGLALLNAFVDSLALQPYTMHRALRTVKTLASGTASYTLGPGGDIDIVRPMQIEAVRLITNTADATPTETPRRLFSDQDWAGIAQKTLTANYIDGVWDDHRFDANSRTTLHVWPIPNVGTTQLVLYTRVAVAEFDQSTAVVLPPGYERMLEYNLACECADYFEKPLSERTQRLAVRTLSQIKGANVRPTRLQMPPGMPGMQRGRGDIRTGQ
jgi:hypothetical protein